MDFESTIGGVIKKGLAKEKKSFRYLLFPIFISGVEGMTGERYDESTWFRAKQILKKVFWDLDWLLIVRPFIGFHLKK